MRNTLIFPPAFELQLLYELLKCKLINYKGEVYPDINLLDKFTNRNITKQKIYQMFMLFENVILLAADEQYDYSVTESLCNFKPLYLDQYAEAIHKLNLDDSKKENALYLKPALLNQLSADLSDFYIIKDSKISARNYFSALYDYTFDITSNLDSNYKKIISQHTELFNKAHVHTSDAINSKSGYLEAVQSIINTTFEDLNLQLDICSRQNAYMLNSIYSIDKIGCQELDFKRHMSAYAILKVECKKAIGTMPVFKAITDVVCFKEKQRRDILRLRQQLDGLEYVLRTQTREAAIKSATEDIKKAVAELNKYASLKNKIGTWTTYLAVPIGTAEILLSIPPIVGITMSIVGLSSEISDRIIRRRSNWVHVVR